MKAIIQQIPCCERPQENLYIDASDKGCQLYITEYDGTESVAIGIDVNSASLIIEILTEFVKANKP